MNVTLGQFAKSGIEDRLGANLRVGVLTALIHYTRRLRSGRRPVAPLRLPGLFPPSEPVTTFELQIGREMRDTLEREARVWRVPLDHLLTHAVFVYLADLESPSRQAAGMADRLH